MSADEMDWNLRAVIGGNEPPEPIEEGPKLPPDEQIQVDLARQYADTVDKYNELQAEIAKLPDPVTSEAELEQLANMITAVNALVKKLEALRAVERAPHEKMVKAVNGWFWGMSKPLEAMVERTGALKRRQTAYLTAKEAAARAEALRIAAEQAAEAKKKAEEAELHRKHAESAEDEERAVAAEQVAVDTQQAATTAARVAQAPAAQHARTRTAIGNIATLVERLEFEIDRDQIDLEKIRPFLSDEALKSAVEHFKRINKSAIEKLTRDPDTPAGYTALAGVRFYIEKTSRN